MKTVILIIPFYQSTSQLVALHPLLRCVPLIPASSSRARPRPGKLIVARWSGGRWRFTAQAVPAVAPPLTVAKK